MEQWGREGKYPGVSKTLLKQWATFDTRNWKFKVTAPAIQRYWDGCFEEVRTKAHEVRERVLATKWLEQGETREPYRHWAPADYPETLAKAMTQTNMVTVTKHPDYKVAKELGDMNAARNIVDRAVNPKTIEKIKRELPEDRDIYIVPVLKEEGASLNLIPLAYAERLAEDLGGKVWTDLTQVQGRSVTHLDAKERLSNQQVFTGPVPPKDGVIIVADDIMASGGTFAAVIDALALEDRTPQYVTALAAGRFGNELKPSKESIDGLLRKARITAKEFQREFGYSPRFLTGVEVRSYNLTGGSGIAGARARFHQTESRPGPGHPQDHAEAPEVAPLKLHTT